MARARRIVAVGLICSVGPALAGASDPIPETIFPRGEARPVAVAADAGTDGALRLALERYRPAVEIRRTSRWSRSLFWAGAAADLYTTKRVLDVPGLEEGNPVLALDGPDDSMVLVTAAAFKGTMYWVVRRMVRRGKLTRRQADGLLGGFGATQGAAAWYNRQRIRKD